MPTWKTMTDSTALWLWSEVFRLASSWNGTTVIEIEHQLITVKLRQIKELVEAMVDEGRLSVTHTGVLGVGTGVSRWEEYAALYADTMLADGDPLLLVNQVEPFDFMVCWLESIAFLEGVAGFPRCSVKAEVAHNAGILAKTLLGERSLTGTRIWEALSRQQWRTAPQIAEAVGWRTSPWTAEKVRYHLFHMNRQHDVVMRKHRGRLEYRLVQW